MLSYSDLKKGILFVLDGAPYEVLEFSFLRMQQRKPVAQTKIKNLVTGKIVERNFHMNESFAEAEIEKEPLKFIYSNKGEFWFTLPNDPSKRFSLTEETIGQAAKFLKPNTEVISIKFGEKIIGVQIPVKMELTVKDAPPGFRGDTATGGSKSVTLETGAQINVPLFVNTGDVIRVNTETGEYVERVEKGKA
jgi:elongation factor P